MDYAHQKGLQFGTDIAFSYGPLGFLITPYYSPSAPWLRVATDTILTFVIVTGFAFLTWRMGGRWRALALGFFGLLAANADPRSELLIALGLLCWSLLCLLGSGLRLKLSLGIFGAIAVFSVLAKMTLLFPAAVGLGAISLCLHLQRKTRFAVALVLGSGSGLLLAWLCLGQSLPHLGPYFVHGFQLTAAYDQTMWADPFPVLKWPALLMLLLAGVLVFYCFNPAEGGTPSKWYPLVLRLWLSALVFIIWKHGFVRAGRDHVEVFFGFVPTLALVLWAWPCAQLSRERWLRGLSLATCVVALFAIQWLFAGNLGSCLARPFRLAALHLGNFWAPRAYQRQMRELQQIETEANQLPQITSKVGRARVDMFGCNQAYAIFNHLNFHPRPVFQSYVAYSAPLMSLNEQFYFSPKAPEFVLFSLNPIDDRFPPLEDARVFRNLLINYQPVGTEGPFLLLKSRQTVAPTLTLLREGTLGPGDVIGLKEYGNVNLWLELDLRANPVGWLGRVLYRSSEVTLAAWCDTPSVRVARFRAPAPMLAGGFLASPAPLDNSDMLDLYAGKPITRPSAYSIEISPAAQHLWSDAIHFRLYRIENQLGNFGGKEVLRLAEFPGFEVAPQDIVATRHTMITVAGKPALLLPPGGYMRFIIPAGAKVIQGSFGFAPASYVLGGATEGAEFRIEAEQPDGTFRSLYSQTLRPGSNSEDRGMKSFSVNCPAVGTKKLVLRVLPLGQKAMVWDLSCWADIRFR